MNKTVFIFRHGETDWNKRKIIQGHTDIPLNETGQAQAHLLGEKLANKGIELIMSSDLQRAALTATIVASYTNCPITYHQDLREFHAGELQSTCSETLTKQNPHWRQLLINNPIYDNHAFPGGETKAAARARTAAMIAACLQAPQQCIALSSHGIAIALMLEALIGHDPHEFVLGSVEFSKK